MFLFREMKMSTACLGCNCTGFSAPFTCTCGEAANKHVTLVETKEEREKRGHPTGYATPYQAMGGLTGFSSLAEGYLRLDPSGRGKGQSEVLSYQENLNTEQADRMTNFSINRSRPWIIRFFVHMPDMIPIVSGKIAH